MKLILFFWAVIVSHSFGSCCLHTLVDRLCVWMRGQHPLCRQQVTATYRAQHSVFNSMLFTGRRPMGTEQDTVRGLWQCR